MGRKKVQMGPVIMVYYSNLQAFNEGHELAMVQLKSYGTTNFDENWESRQHRFIHSGNVQRKLLRYTKSSIDFLWRPSKIRQVSVKICEEIGSVFTSVPYAITQRFAQPTTLVYILSSDCPLSRIFPHFEEIWRSTGWVLLLFSARNFESQKMLENMRIKF